MKKTKKEYELYLNRFGEECPQINDKGKQIKHYGTWLRKNDPTMFNLEYRTWTFEYKE